MPRYNYACPHCGHEFEWDCFMAERLHVLCPKCEKVTARDYSKYGKGGGSVHVFAPMDKGHGTRLYEHLGSEPVRVSSKQQLHDEVAKAAEEAGQKVSMPAYDFEESGR